MKSLRELVERRLHPEQRVVRFFHEYCCEWPLWESGTSRYPGAPSDYGLSPALTARLRRCGDLFDHYHYEKGWPSPQMHQQYAEGMKEALKLLRQELRGTAIVRDEHKWCVKRPPLRTRILRRRR